MKKKSFRVIAMGLICMFLLSACGGGAAKPVLFKSAGGEKIQALKTTSSSGYSYGQSLWVVNCKEFISLRNRSSTSADVLQEIPLYGRVTYLGDASNGFLYVMYNGQDGYALAKYLDEYEPQIAIGMYMTVVKCKESITLRKKPSTKAAEICQIPLGAVVYAVKEAANGFYMVEYNGMSGYALSSYLSSSDTGRSDGSSGSNGYYYGQPLWVVLCKEYISLRSSPSTSANVLDKIPLYAEVTYLGDASNGFYLVAYNGQAGYALAKYLDEFEPQIAIGEYMTVVKCKESITLRKKPSTKAEEICQIPLGKVVYVVKDAGNGFYMVEYNGKRGYALSSYLS